MTFQYRAVDKPQAIERKVYPISLKQKDGVWYLIGYDLERKGLRVFTASKVQHVSTHLSTYKTPPRLALVQAQKIGEFSIWDTSNSGEVMQTIKVKLWGHAADFVLSHKIHSSQKVELEGEGVVVLSLETSDLLGVRLWLRKFLQLVEIIEPDELRTEFINDLKVTLKAHS